MWLYEPEPNIHYTQLTGVLEHGTLAAIKRVGDEIYTRGVPVWAVHDWEDATGYETAVRDLYVKWSFARRDALAGACILGPAGVPGIVMMGVSVGAMALSAVGVSVNVYQKRPLFTLRFLELARMGRAKRG
jgi:hypothetical protein